MRETSFEMAQELYQLSGWRGVVEWFAGRDITADNYPGYTLGYLVCKLGELLPDATAAELLSALAEVMDGFERTFEDAAALLCLQLLRQGALAEAS